MPLFVYFCDTCELKFEKLRKKEDNEKPDICPICGKLSDRTFQGNTVSIGTKLDPKKDTVYSNKEIDKVVGAAAEKKWEGYNEKWKKTYDKRRELRHKGREVKEINLPKEKDGSYRPLLHLGDKKQREGRKEFSEAFQEHSSELKRKGLSQFDGPGAIDE